MFIKHKSALVVSFSSIAIFLVMIATLIGYYMYVELKAREDEIICNNILHKLQSRIFSKYVVIDDIALDIESEGPLRRTPVIKGTLSNKSSSPLTGIVIKATISDSEGRRLYEAVFQPLEPVYGIRHLGSLTMSYLTGTQKNYLQGASKASFKYVARDLPHGLRLTPVRPAQEKQGTTSARQPRTSTITARIVSVTL